MSGPHLVREHYHDFGRHRRPGILNRLLLLRGGASADVLPSNSPGRPCVTQTAQDCSHNNSAKSLILL